MNNVSAKCITSNNILDYISFHNTQWENASSISITIFLHSQDGPRICKKCPFFKVSMNNRETVTSNAMQYA